MKTIFLFLLGASLFMSCNNSNSDTKKDEVTNAKDNTKDNSKDNNAPSNNGWTAKDRDAFIEKCRKTGGEKQCKCMLQKVENKYPNAKDVANISEREMKDFKIDCDTD